MPSSPRRSTEIALTGMRFHVCVGILPHERTLPQPLEVDLRVRLSASGGPVLDYRALYSLVSTVVNAGPLEFLEQVAEQIVAAALALDGVAWARTALRKPHVALGGPLAFAEVVMESGDA